MLPAIFTRDGGNPFGAGQRAQVARQGGAIHSDFLRQSRVTQLAGAGKVGQEGVLRDGEVPGRQNGVVKGGKFPGYSANLGTDAGAKFRRTQFLVKGFLHRCRCTCVLFDYHIFG